MKTKENTIKKTFTGVVTSDKMDKTIVVRVDSVKMHDKYNKQYVSSKKYKVHDEKNEAKVGQQVIFEEARPLSKDKNHRLIQIKK